LEKIEKAEIRKMKIAEEIKKCNFNISEKKKVFIKYIKIYIF